MVSSTLALHFPIQTPSIFTPQTFPQHNSTKTPLFHHHPKLSIACKATSSSSSSFVREYDLYDLMGIDSSSDQIQIKKAYRSLQKRCHPDIAGPAGHDMAIILNHAYALLSDPVARAAYDKEQAKMTELQGYTGQPMYSSWLGPETEERAVFVDEVKCVGCLKCALLANKTFAIEAAYGRARVVAQWADPEDKIQASIDVCPVSCISIVERSDLAALEFLMSKQPRGPVRIGASNTAGARSFDVFSEVKVFNKRLEEAAARKSNRDSKYTKLQSDAAMSAIQAIRSISNWLYWQTPAASETRSYLALKEATESVDPDLEKLRDAAAEARKHGRFQNTENKRHQPSTTSTDDYWTPSIPVQVNPKNTAYSDTLKQAASSENGKTVQEKTYVKRKNYPRRPIVTVLPLGFAVLASINAILHGTGAGVSGLEQHIYGSLALQVVNSSWLQVILAGVPWYLIGIVAELLVDGFSSRDRL